jgi:excisionase family DNA binding protein
MSALSPEIQYAIDTSVARAIAQRLPSPRETYLRIKEAAAQLSVHPDTISRFISAGTLRAVGAGKLLRVPQSAIAEYLESSTAVRAAVTK